MIDYTFRNGNIITGEYGTNYVLCCLRIPFECDGYADAICQTEITDSYIVSSVHHGLLLINTQQVPVSGSEMRKRSLHSASGKAWKCCIYDSRWRETVDLPPMKIVECLHGQKLEKSNNMRGRRL